MKKLTFVATALAVAFGLTACSGLDKTADNKRKKPEWVVRGPGAVILNLSLGKKFAVTEHKWFELRGESFNLANTPIFNSPISQTVGTGTFGEISTTTGERNLQVVAKFYF